MSTHQALIVPIKLEKHDNADSLSIVRVNDYTVVVRTESWKDTPLGVYIEPDTIVNVNRPEFSFLKTKVDQEEHLIRAKRLRGVWSYGLLVPCTELIGNIDPNSLNEGDDLWEALELKHYEPPTLEERILSNKRGNKVLSPMVEELSIAPSWNISKYDLENYKKFHTSEFISGEELIVTEKLHGENVRFLYDSKLEMQFCGTRNQWKKQYPTFLNYDIEYFTSKGYTEDKAKEIVALLDNKKSNPPLSSVWKLFNKYPQIAEFCGAYPDMVLFGEHYGHVQKGFSYDSPGEGSFRAFDVLDLKENKFLDYHLAVDILDAYSIPRVPFVTQCVYPDDMEYIKNLSQGPSYLNPSHIKEGFVLRPIKERRGQKCHRAVLKLINPEYLELKE